MARIMRYQKSMNCESLQRFFGRRASFLASKNFTGHVYFEIHSPKRHCSTGKLVESSYLRSYLKHFKVLTGNGVRLKNTLVFSSKVITSPAK